MITAAAFRAIEASLTKRLAGALSVVAKKVLKKVDVALAEGDTALALQELQAMKLDGIRDEVGKYVEYMTTAAMLFGASRVTQAPGTSVVGMGFHRTQVLQMTNSFMQMVTVSASKQLMLAGEKYIRGKEVTKAESVLRPFESFMNEQGRAYFNLSASLHTSRVSAYGFTAEAEALGLVEYQINEQLDTRVCPVCREMHGKKFKVEDARRLLDVVCRATDPEDLKQLQPWPGQSQDSMELIKGMSSADLVQRGWHIPPYHPGCRGLLGRVGLVKPLSGAPRAEKYESSKEDFKSIGVSINDAQLRKWNSAINISPVEMVARLTGKNTEELIAGLLEAENPKAYAGLNLLKVAKQITMETLSEGFGSKDGILQKVKIDTDRKAITLDLVRLSEDEQGAGIVKKYMRELYTVAKDSGMKSLDLYAGLDVGGYAWAKYGFSPSEAAWKSLKKKIKSRARVIGYGEKLSALEAETLDKILDSTDPKSIFTLSDISFGKDLLLGQNWMGSIDLSDPESVVRFLSYIGEL